VVNDHIKMDVGLHIIYDDDIKAKKRVDGIQITVGPKLQLKQKFRCWNYLYAIKIGLILNKPIFYI
jgi:hypothetical protein